MRTSTRTTTRTLLTGAAALSLALTVTACGDDSADDGATAPAITAGAEGDTPTSEDTAGTISPEATEATTAGSESERDANSVVFDAIDLAEQDAGGTAVEVEHEDRPDSEGVWEISVAVDDEEMELLVSFDGTEVLDSKSDGSLDSEDRNGLDAAEVGVADAIRTALDEVDGTFDEAELDREGDAFVWEVEIEQDGQDTEVYIDVVSGDVLHVD